MSIRVSILVFSLSLAGSALLSGCAGSFDALTNPVESRQTPIGEISGAVHGGQAPVTGAQIYLFAASTGGYGTAATSLITSGKPGVTCNTSGSLNGDCYVLTDSSGNFALGGDYTCTAGTQVYMVAVGGDPGLTGTVNNTAIVQMAGLAQCPAAGNLAAQVPYLVINEVTTVAFAYAMSGFATTAFNVSADASGATAMANAMANTNNIVNLQYGQAPAVANGNPNSINPQSKLYALANIVAACVNTSSPSSSGCANLFQFATTSTGTQATDEANALFNIAHNQAQNVVSLWNLTPASPVFTPTLSSQPTDWTMPVIYKALVSLPGNIVNNQITSGPFNIAFDASGNAWIGDRVKGAVEVGPQGASSTFNSGFGMVKGVAVSPIDGTIWVSDYNNNTVDVMDTTGTVLSQLTTDLNGPILTAFSGNASGRSLAFEANETTTSVVVFDSTAFSLKDFETGAVFANVAGPGWISVDNTGNAWIPSTNTTYIGEVADKERGNSGNFTFTASETNGSPNSYSTVSDSNSNIWLASITGTARLERIPAGSSSVTSSWTGGGMNGPFKLAVDGGNNIWVSNANANTVSGFNSTGNGSWLATNGFSTSAPGGAGCVVAAPDPSGNLWSANSDGSVTQLLGLATPTAAPLYGGIKSTGSNSTPGNLWMMP
jgi:hypothetical protein